MARKRENEIIKQRDEQWEHYLEYRTDGYPPRYVTHDSYIPRTIYKLLAPHMNDILKQESSNVREECAQLVRAMCQACKGSGHAAQLNEDTWLECEYCGRTMDAIRKGNK